jgi:hypothetical protein
MKTTLKLVILFLLLLPSFPIYAQGNINLTSTDANSLTDWQVCKHLDLADIYYKKAVCQRNDEVSFQYLLIKVVNTSGEAIQIAWEYKLFINNEEVVKSPDDMKLQFSLDAKCSVEGKCQDEDNNKLKVFIAEGTGASMINSFDLTNLSIKAK